MRRLSLKTLQKKVSQATIFYGKEDISPQDFFRWHTSPFLARTLFNVDCDNKLYSKLVKDISLLKNNLPIISQSQVKVSINIIEQKSKTFLHRSYYFLGGLVTLALLLFLYFTSDNKTLGRILADSAGIIWVVYIVSTIFIISISETITDVYISRLSEYKALLGFLNPLFIAYKNKLEFWENLSWQNFEREVTKRLNQFGYNAVNTKLSGDEGVDIVINNQDNKFIVQCKAMKNKIGPSFVRDFVGTMRIQNASGGMIVSLNGFSEGSLEASDYQNLYLLSIQDFILLDKEMLHKIIGW